MRIKKRTIKITYFFLDKFVILLREKYQIEKWCLKSFNKRDKLWRASSNKQQTKADRLHILRRS